MFDDLDSEDSAVSAPQAAEGVQGTVDEQLIEQVLQDAEESHDGADSITESSGTETAAESTPDLGEDSAEEAPASATSDPAEAPAEAPASEQSEDAPEVFRTPDYEEKIRSIQNAPLRTPKPDVPPLPGVTYVNPWT
ncbi:Uncharacterised protein [Mycobacterium tuberculosis]|nr:Uncharacterised protein [Mycobacterium tuberculosis]